MIHVINIVLNQSQQRSEKRPLDPGWSAQTSLKSLQKCSVCIHLHFHLQKMMLTCLN